MSDKENKRKCFKCGASPANDGIRLFRVLKPGVRNLVRCEQWVQYMFPEKAGTSLEFKNKLYNEHRMLCERHFQDEDFTDSTKKQLLRTAVPCDREPTLQSYPSVEHGERILLGEISLSQNIEGKPPPTSTIPSEKKIPLKSAQMEAGPSTAPSATTGQALHTRENVLLGKCRKYMLKVYQLRHRIEKLKTKEIINAVSEDKTIKKLSKKITPSFALLLQGQIRNLKKSKTARRWSKEEKITALRIFKRSPTCYRLLRRLFPLPSVSTLKALLRRLPFGVGVNKQIFTVLKKFAETQAPKDNLYVVMFDEMSLKKHYQYNPKDDVIEGYQDHGTQGRTSVPASYALVFMIAGIRKKIKQPIAHFFSSSFATADRLAVLIKEVLKQV